MSEGTLDTKEGRKLREVAQALPELLDAISGKVPALIRGLIETVFSEQAGRELGKAVAAFYRELKAGGMPDSMVNEIVLEYMRVQGAMLGGFAKQGAMPGSFVKSGPDPRRAEPGAKPEGHETAKEPGVE